MTYKGKIPRKIDVAEWREEKFLAFFEFLHLFLEEKNGSYSYIVSSQNRSAAAFIDKPFYKEFIQRLEIKDCNDTRFKKRITSFTRIVLLFLRESPYAITEDMKSIMEKNDRLSWALNAYKQITTEIGAEIVVPNDDDETDPNNQRAVAVTSPQVNYQQAILAMTSILRDLVKGVTPEEIKKMDIEKRLKIAIPMVQALGKAFNGPAINMSVFKQINVNTTGREDLEKTLLEYGDSQME